MCDVWVAGCASKNGYQKDMCLKEIGLRAENMSTIIGSTYYDQHKWEGGDPYDYLTKHGILHSDNE